MAIDQNSATPRTPTMEILVVADPFTGLVLGQASEETSLEAGPPSARLLVLEASRSSSLPRASRAPGSRTQDGE